MKYKRILLKLSGESLMGTKQFGIDNNMLSKYAGEIKQIVDQGIEVAIVVGGGNIFRGEANVILKGTRVDGIYTADPEKNPDAKKYDTITFEEVYEKNLNVMDMTAFTLCKENKLPIIVFDMNQNGNLLKIVNGETIGTLVKI